MKMKKTMKSQVVLYAETEQKMLENELIALKMIDQAH
jgi:hypothetical protein